MKKFDQLICKIFLYGLPVAIGLAVFSSYITFQHLSEYSQPVQSLYNFSGFIFGAWISFSLYLSLRLIFSSQFRDNILLRLSFFKERDEREEFVSAKATKNTYLVTLALLICFLCLSVFQVSIYRVPAEMASNGKTGTVSLGLSLDLLDHRDSNEILKENASKEYFTYQGLPLSKTAIFLFLILLQVVAYNLFYKKFN